MSGVTSFRRNMFHVSCRPSTISGRGSPGRISELNQIKVCLSFPHKCTLYESHITVFSYIRVMSSCNFLFSKNIQAPRFLTKMFSSCLPLHQYRRPTIVRQILKLRQFADSLQILIAETMRSV